MYQHHSMWTQLQTINYWHQLQIPFISLVNVEVASPSSHTSLLCHMETLLVLCRLPPDSCSSHPFLPSHLLCQAARCGGAACSGSLALNTVGRVGDYSAKAMEAVRLNCHWTVDLTSSILFTLNFKIKEIVENTWSSDGAGWRHHRFSFTLTGRITQAKSHMFPSWLAFLNLRV